MAGGLRRHTQRAVARRVRFDERRPAGVHRARGSGGGGGRGERRLRRGARRAGESAERRGERVEARPACGVVAAAKGDSRAGRVGGLAAGRMRVVLLLVAAGSLCAQDPPDPQNKWYDIHGQATTVIDTHGPFHAPYSGSHSLRSLRETDTSFTITD